MKIAIIGAGNVGGTLGRRWAQNGHEVTFGVRDPQSPKVQDVLRAAGAKARAVSVREAATAAECILLATPWTATQDAIQTAGNLSGKIVVDCTNPLAPGLRGLALGHTTSGGEQVAKWAVGARVVKAFNMTGAKNMASPAYGAQPITMCICGDDAAAKTTVGGLAAELGFEVVDTGPLTTARYLEPLAMLWIHLAYVQGLGPDFAFKIMRRP
jgi:8-hydroxy-5-deazaflavin:NADPH oxidoreductase